MVATRETPDLIPVPPEWLAREEERRPANANRNINDIYWRKPDGWIVTGPSAVMGQNGRPLTAQAESKMRRGWTPLVEYSYTNRISPKTQQRETIEINADRLNTPDRYYWFFRNGGAHLFPIEQIVEFHWHLTPPYGLPKSVFPQLDEWEVPEAYHCPACPGNRPPKNSVEEVVKHLMVEHRLDLPQVRDLQTATHDFQDAPRPASGLALRRKVQATEAKAAAREGVTSKDQPKAQLMVCNACGEPIKGKLKDHNCS